MKSIIQLIKKLEFLQLNIDYEKLKIIGNIIEKLKIYHFINGISRDMPI